MLSGIMGLLGFLPKVLNFAEAWQKNKYDAQVQITAAKIGGNTEQAKALVSAHNAQEEANVKRLGIFASNKFLTILLITAAIPLVGYEWKVYVYDTMLGWGSTEAVKGQVAEWGNTVWWFLFGSPTVMGIGKMWMNKNSGEDTK